MIDWILVSSWNHCVLIPFLKYFCIIQHDYIHILQLSKYSSLLRILHFHIRKKTGFILTMTKNIYLSFYQGMMWGGFQQWIFENTNMNCNDCRLGKQNCLQTGLNNIFQRSKLKYDNRGSFHRKLHRAELSLSPEGAPSKIFTSERNINICQASKVNYELFLY